jgi:hypothetical protein
MKNFNKIILVLAVTLLSSFSQNALAAKSSAADRAAATAAAVARNLAIQQQNSLSGCQKTADGKYCANVVALSSPSPH